jgi:hypothetical protein
LGYLYKKNDKNVKVLTKGIFYIKIESKKDDGPGGEGAAAFGPGRLRGRRRRLRADPGRQRLERQVGRHDSLKSGKKIIFKVEMTAIIEFILLGLSRDDSNN